MKYVTEIILVFKGEIIIPIFEILDRIGLVNFTERNHLEIRYLAIILAIISKIENFHLREWVPSFFKRYMKTRKQRARNGGKTQEKRRKIAGKTGLKRAV